MSDRPAKDTVVIYHGDCLDGFCAAWVAWRYFEDAAEYIPAYYGQPAPDVTGKRVYVLDFSYPYDVTVRMIEQSRGFVLLDHHQTAEADLAQLKRSPVGEGKARIIFDMDRSGAGLARDHFEPDLKSWLVSYTQDRDLWKFELRDSKLVNAYIGTLKQTFEAYENAHRFVSVSQAAEFGRGADAYRNMYVEKLVKHARRVRFAGFDDIPIVNAPYIGISELVGALAETALFAVGWFQRSDGKVAFSLRSRGAFDVSKVAKRFGGGGHRGAAGFTSDLVLDQLSSGMVFEP